MVIQKCTFTYFAARQKYSIGKDFVLKRIDYLIPIEFSLLLIFTSGAAKIRRSENMFFICILLFLILRSIVLQGRGRELKLQEDEI